MDASVELRLAAGQAVAALGAAAATPEILDQLTKLLQDEDEQVRKAAEEVLARCRRIS